MLANLFVLAFQANEFSQCVRTYEVLPRHETMARDEYGAAQELLATQRVLQRLRSLRP